MKQHNMVFDFSISAKHSLMRTAMAAVFVIIAVSANAAGVVSRGGSTTTARPTTSRVNGAETRMPTISTQTVNTVSSSDNQNTDTTSVTTKTSAPAPKPAVVDDEPIIIENKSDQFSAGMAAASSGGRDSNAQNLADMVRRQRAALDAQSASDAANALLESSLASGQSACDIGLRDCMKQKCGNDYSKCAGDGDTIWGDKLDACRRNVTCTGHQYALFTKEIKADRDMNAKLSAYNKIIDCGNNYNDCIVTECGETYSKCLGKTAGDAAISKCGTIAKNCVQQDSGLAARTMNVFATLRQDAEKQIVKDEQRLYEMRDKMRSQCQRMGALFDERSLVCVYTVNFFAGDTATPMASKKAYAGTSFDCNQEWFGVDVTTFKENAYRYTRSQTSASSALMGSGLGIGVGAVTSGAIDRAIDRQKANKALKQAEKEHDENYGEGAKKDGDSDDEDDTDDEDDDTDDEDDEGDDEDDGEDNGAENGDKKTDKQAKKAEKDAKKTEKKKESDAKKAEKAAKKADKAKSTKTTNTNTGNASQSKPHVAEK